MRKRAPNWQRKWVWDNSANAAPADPRTAGVAPARARRTARNAGRAVDLAVSRSGQNECLARFVANAADHGFKSVRSLWREVLAKPEALEQRQRVDIKNVAGAISRVEGEQNRDQAAHDVGVAVAGETQNRLALCAPFDVGQQPHLARAARHLVGLGPRPLRQRFECAPQFDHVTIAIIPLIEQGEVRGDFVDLHDGPRWVTLPTPTYDGQGGLAIGRTLIVMSLRQLDGQIASRIEAGTSSGERR